MKKYCFFFSFFFFYIMFALPAFANIDIVHIIVFKTGFAVHEFAWSESSILGSASAIDEFFAEEQAITNAQDKSKWYKILFANSGTSKYNTIVSLSANSKLMNDFQPGYVRADQVTPRSLQTCDVELLAQTSY